MTETISEERLRETYANLPNTHKAWGNNGRLFGAICRMNGKEWVQVEGSFDPDHPDDGIDSPEATAAARNLCEVVNALPALLNELSRLRSENEGLVRHQIVSRATAWADHHYKARAEAAEARLDRVREECERLRDPLYASSPMANAILAILNDTGGE